jgi:hypothetical protein
VLPILEEEVAALMRQIRAELVALVVAVMVDLAQLVRMELPIQVAVLVVDGLA